MLFISSILIFVSNLSFNSLPDNNRSFVVYDTIVYSVSTNFLRGCDNGASCEPVLIQRTSNSIPVKLILPKGGTQTDIYLYDPKRFAGSKRTWLQENHAMMGGKELSFDLTNIKDGEYVINYGSCHWGAVFRIIIKTDPVT